MPVDRIIRIVRKILRSKYSLIAIILCFIILCISVYEDLPINYNKRTIFNEKNNENDNKRTYNKNNTENLNYQSASDKIRTFIIILTIVVYITIILIVINFCFFYHRLILANLLNLLYNRLFPRNQNDEPELAVYFQQNDGIQVTGQNIRENNGENVHQELLPDKGKPRSEF